ncbi:peptide chain release factor 1 [Desulfoluna limicola]|uniref:Peptide chain release factor 1 n=2 Tax=Desulfoluna limicola TaxID=2810562 RepID=A0ABM7PPV9_9BACT|nr:peptide chain release factor 1 [Desulfoluna limicola]
MGQAKAMFNKLKGVEDRFIKLEQLLSDPAVVSDRVLYQKYIKEHGEISKLMEAYRRYKKIVADLEEARDLLTDDDPDMKEMAQEEIGPLEEQKAALEEELKILLIPKDPLDEKSVIVELRAGTGGDESALFAGDLFKMYTRYAESLGWAVEVMDSHASDVGGFKEVVFQVSGKGAYSSFKYESGVHRVQRVPATETQGRIHTSAVTVAVLPEAEDVELKIEPNELRIDIFRSSGPGGQSVNTTDSAVRITHIPSGITATCQDEKSQHKNREKAMKVLRSRVLDKMIQETEAKRSAERKGQIGSGDRSERIRTYNFPQGRMTDHRIGLTLYRLEAIMEGSIEEIISSLRTHAQAQALKNEQSL